MGNDTLIEQPQYHDLILSHLTAEDDKDFWSTAVTVLLHDVATDLENARPKTDIYAQIGACSHWLRPHQTRWTTAGGFAWPSGYGASDYSRLGVPEFDWFVLLRRDFETQSWQPVHKLAGKRHLIFRVALPTRTTRHPQAAIHTIWLPRRPSDGQQKALRIYGFRKIDGVWQCVASH
jgi:hypothetical protein